MPLPQQDQYPQKYSKMEEILLKKRKDPKFAHRKIASFW